MTCGVPPRTIDNWVRSGRLIRKFPGVYRLGHEAVPPFSDELAAVLACGPETFLSHQSAALLWSILRTSPSNYEIIVTVVGRRVRSRAGIEVRGVRELRRAERTTHHGIPVTTPARTLFDLAAVASRRTLDRAMNEAQVLGLARPSALSPLLALHPRHPGAAAVRSLIAEPQLGFTRSDAERRFLDLMRAAQLPAPRTNVRVAGLEVDFLWPAERLIVEVDGFGFHSSRASFERDRARDAQLTALGHRVMRVTWRQIADQPHAVVARTAQALASAR